jgi:hypothetical protein
MIPGGSCRVNTREVTVRTLPCIAGVSDNLAMTSSLGVSVIPTRSYSP